METVELYFNQADEVELGKCGFACSTCPTFLNNNCAGCMKEHSEGDCYTRDCVLSQGIKACGYCKDFPCETIISKPHSTVLDKDWLKWKRESNTNR